MALPLSRWTQKKLLYPVAVFAVIVPTVLMALYGTWALREIELRPTSSADFGGATVVKASS